MKEYSKNIFMIFRIAINKNIFYLIIGKFEKLKLLINN